MRTTFHTAVVFLLFVAIAAAAFLWEASGARAGDCSNWGIDEWDQCVTATSYGNAKVADYDIDFSFVSSGALMVFKESVSSNVSVWVKLDNESAYQAIDTNPAYWSSISTGSHTLHVHVQLSNTDQDASSVLKVYRVGDHHVTVGTYIFAD